MILASFLIISATHGQQQLNTKIIRVKSVAQQEKKNAVATHNPTAYRTITSDYRVVRTPSLIGRHNDGRGERRRILVAPSQLEEQRGCAVLAFREWLAPLAQKTSRSLVVPQRFANLFNFSTVARAWKKNCRLKDVVYEPGYYKGHYAHLCRRNESTSFTLRIEKDWRSGQNWGPAESLVPCPPKQKKAKRANRQQVVDESGEEEGKEGGNDEDEEDEEDEADACLVLRGRASLFQLLKMVPALNDGVPCLRITHAARGFKTKAPCRRDSWGEIDYLEPYHALARDFLAAHDHSSGRDAARKQARKAALGGLRPPPLAVGRGYLSLHLRTEKCPIAAAVSPACWAQIGRALALALRRKGLTTVFIGSGECVVLVLE